MNQFTQTENYELGELLGKAARGLGIETNWSKQVFGRVQTRGDACFDAGTVIYSVGAHFGVGD